MLGAAALGCGSGGETLFPTGHGGSGGAGGGKSGTGGKGGAIGTGGTMTTGTGGVGGGGQCTSGETQECYSGDPATKGVGSCKAGTQTCVDGAWGACAGEVAPALETCNGQDDDCNGAIDDGFAPVTCGVGACQVMVNPCVDGQPVDCVPLPPTSETCNGIDDNCDGQVDEGCKCVDGATQPCYTGPSATQHVGVCADGSQTCVNGQWGACTGDVLPSAEKCDGKDNDCDGVVDNGNPDGGQTCNTGKPGVCGPGTVKCSNGTLFCTQNVQPSAEICDGIDNNCDGTVDEGNPGSGMPCTTGQAGSCSAGTTTCLNGATVCKANAGFPEVCDGLDNDCDGVVDNGNPGGGFACNTGKFGACSVGIATCTGGSVLCVQTAQPTAEICDGKDNDCDGIVDNGNPGGGQVCSTGKVGECAAGTTACAGGGVVCNQNVQASAEICDGKDNNCDGQIDEGNPGGGAACNTGKPGMCATGTVQCKNGALGCVQNTQPAPEVCDGLDNNCDGAIDEGNPGGGQSCTTGKQGVCSVGTTFCGAGSIKCVQNVQPGPEVCDGLDNNCDGNVDEGNPGGGAACNTGKLGVCAAGTMKCINGALQCVQNVQPSAEICDGKDNNCDGTIDEGSPGAGVSCSTGKLGVCSAGITACTNGVLLCSQLVQPGPEVCDGLDNNCNGTVDEGNPGGGGTCNTGKPGVCGAGTLNCIAGAVQCVQTVQPSSEICDGKDNNCDGQIDEGNPNSGAPCNTGKLGVCAAGTTACTNGVVVCNQNVQPSAEVCDGLDNNCDGTVDNNTPGTGQACTTGLFGICSAGTTTCTNGQFKCTQNSQPVAEICGNGLDDNCDGVVDPPVTVYFSESFANNNAGWTLGPEWQIGPAVAGCSDPGVDTTPTADNGIAGVGLGTCASRVVHGSYYLTSPAVNTAGATKLILQFNRWLTSDYTPYMGNSIEVWNGTIWVPVYQTGSSPGVVDGSWQKITLDITAYRNAALQVRWGFYIGNTGVINAGGWNIDDVQITNGACN